MTVYDRIFTPYIYTVYDRKFGDFPAKITVYTPYIYGSGQPYKCAINSLYITRPYFSQFYWYPLQSIYSVCTWCVCVCVCLRVWA